ncbi:MULTISPECIES: LysR family transcriptional regulator [unclassified Bradyrhizobium]|uniref:LysR family transcriptional regulator n=1 Tax=unclassified Bradyrhizobium TaxID=2631580 RepID=UPI002478DCEB|nr:MULTISPECIES: LysR family transcriptional regulator [unclassified Bradyrhizobium]WGS17510.1 LysR family transcriptional regulator [Bradyrhizobium sp. ISRA463]WGS24291.1 LysR family transcriptional regulator [Bradyrhizobium sp. ISRA464]
MDPLDGIAAFVRVVDSGSFSAAAARLKISKSAVSAHVQRLENRLGVRLLNRTTRRVSLTEAGAAYYRHCIRILAEAEAAEQAAAALQHQPRGTLRISAPDSFGWMHVAPALSGFLRRYSELAVHITLSPAHVNLVDEGLDLAIRIGVLEDSRLVVRKLAPSRIILCAAPAYLDARGMPRKPEDLTQHNCICTALLPWGGEWSLIGPRGKVRMAVSGSFRSNSAEMLRAAALDGVGISVLPTWAAAEPLRTGALRRVLPRWELPASAIYAVYPGNRLMSMKVRAFVNHLARSFGRPPHWDANI